MRGWVVVLAAGALSCDLVKPTENRAEDILGLTGEPVHGEAVFVANCVECHRLSGLGVDDPADPGAGQNLTEAAGEVEEDAEFVEIILDGEEEMPGFGATLDDQEIADVIAYIHDSLIQE